MTYKILPYTKHKAKSLGLEVKPSRNRKKKIDVFKGDEKIGSIGAIGYYDYPTYLEMEKTGEVEKGTAENRRKLYKKRHTDRHKKWTPSWLADQLLW